VAFEHCTNLISVAIPNSVTNIGSEAFRACTSLTSATIGNSVTSIEDEAFYNCALTNIIVGNSVTNIENEAFAYCTNLASVYFEGNAPTADADVFYGDNKATVYYLPGTTGWGPMFGGIPSAPQFNETAQNGMITINGYNGPGGTVTIPDAINSQPVTSIGANAFENASLSSVTIPASITSIGANAFLDCANLTSVYFTGNAPTADSTVFINDNATVYYLSGMTGWSNTFAGVPAVLWNPLIQTADGSFGVRNKQFGFNITGTNNFTVVVEACTNLANPAWTPLQTVTLTNGSFYFSEPLQTNSPDRFYGLGLP
jgi:hypothetical protein